MPRIRKKSMMMDRRANNLNVFHDTMDWISKSGELKDAVALSTKNQRLYFDSEEVDLPEAPSRTCTTVVSKKRSFEAAATYAREGKKVCVLNFASATNPGGGVTRGSSAQEECLCRCSTLYPCLREDALWKGFYIPHRNAGNPCYNDDCIYTPGVIVCKSDVSSPERLDKEDWYQVDVLTCAAPNLRQVPGNANAGGELLQLHLRRVERIFRVAAKNGAEVLILGAFGCGAFCNPPEVVANAFKIVQEKYETYFEAIEYAVFCGRHETLNYETFVETFY